MEEDFVDSAATAVIAEPHLAIEVTTHHCTTVARHDIETTGTGEESALA